MAWNPSKRFYVLPDRSPVAYPGNANLWAYRHLTNTYLYPYDGSSYNTDFIDPKIFFEKYVEPASPKWDDDTNHPGNYVDHVLNLETQNVWNTDLDDYWDVTQQYINIANMIKQTGQAAYIYGVSTGPVEYNRWYNIGRYTYRLTPELYPEYEQKLTQSKQEMSRFRKDEREQILGNLFRLRDRFAPFVDAMVLDLYQYYPFSSVNDPEFQYWKFMTRRKIESYRHVFGPDMPLYAFIQPDFTEDFSEIPKDVWDAMVGEVDSNDDIDRVYIFNLSGSSSNQDWQDVLVDGPVYVPS